MRNSKTKLFGDNSFNYYGWLLAGLVLFAASAFTVVLALRTGEQPSAMVFMLVAIYLMLVGLFGIAWQNYLARVGERLDATKNEKAGDHSA